MFGTSKCVLYSEVFLLCPLFGVSFIGGSTIVITYTKFNGYLLKIASNISAIIL